MTLSPDTSPQASALPETVNTDQVVELLATWSSLTAFDVGAHLGCDEAEALATVFMLVQLTDLAAALIYAHAGSDEDPDSVSTNDRHRHLDDQERAAEFVKTLIPGSST